ncbi:MAG: YihY/virulence factor BrkB family protein [Betaproteobacteria bacterium]
MNIAPPSTSDASEHRSEIRDAVECGLATGRPPGIARAWAVAKALVANWSDLDVMRKAAALAYYAAFSVVPILVIALWVGALVVDAANLRTHVLAQLGAVFGQAAASWASEAIASAGEFQSGVAAVVSLVLLVVGATTSLAELKSSLDEIFGIEGTAGESWLSLVRARAYAFGLILTLGFLLVLSLFANALLAQALAWGGNRFGLSAPWLAQLVAEVTTFLSTAALFAAVYAWLPSRHIGTRAVLRATLISAALFTIGRWVVATWLATGEAVSSFGAAASLALILLWFYYSAVIFYTAAILAAGDPAKITRAAPGAARP